jgi:hypothetical protein
MGLLNPFSFTLSLLGRFIQATTPNAWPPPSPTGRQGAQAPDLKKTHD